MPSFSRPRTILQHSADSARTRCRIRHEAGVPGRIQFRIAPPLSAGNTRVAGTVCSFGNGSAERRRGTASMKVMTILGTRPEIIRLSLIIPKLDRLSEHTLVHTGQHYEPELDTLFFQTMKIRRPDCQMDTRAKTTFAQVATILKSTETFIDEIRPDACLILGDTNSGLSAIVSEKVEVSVFNMEAGNRCFDRTVLDERKRKIIDALSSCRYHNVP